MFRRVLMLIVVPMSGLVAQATPLRITISAPNNAEFRVVRPNDPANRTMFGGGRWEITADSGAVAAWTVIATDSMSRVHVEATQNNRVVASGDGAFVAIRRDTAFVSVEARNRAPTSFAPADLRKP